MLRQTVDLLRGRDHPAERRGLFAACVENAHRGSGPDMLRVGRMYEEGDGVERWVRDLHHGCTPTATATTTTTTTTTTITITPHTPPQRHAASHHVVQVRDYGRLFRGAQHYGETLRRRGDSRRG